MTTGPGDDTPYVFGGHAREPSAAELAERRRRQQDLARRLAEAEAEERAAATRSRRRPPGGPLRAAGRRARADGPTVPPGSARAGSAGPGTPSDGLRHADGRRRWGLIAVAALFVAVVGLEVVGRTNGESPVGNALGLTQPPPPRPDSWPSPPVEPSTERLRPEVEPPADPGAFGFMATQADGSTPVGYDPCRPIHYVVNTAGVSAEVGAMVPDAMATISDVTGLWFIQDGFSDERPSTERPPFQPERYGDRWAPVLVSFSDEATFPELTTHVAGVGGSTAVSDPSRDDRLVYVSGLAIYNGATLDEMMGAPGGPDMVFDVLLHELGHLVGLDHVDDPAQVMFPNVTARPQRGFASGDLAGLAAVGAGECHPEV